MRATALYMLVPLITRIQYFKKQLLLFSFNYIGNKEIHPGYKQFYQHGNRVKSHERTPTPCVQGGNTVTFRMCPFRKLPLPVYKIVHLHLRLWPCKSTISVVQWLLSFYLAIGLYILVISISVNTSLLCSYSCIYGEWWVHHNLLHHFHTSSGHFRVSKFSLFETNLLRTFLNVHLCAQGQVFFRFPPRLVSLGQRLLHVKWCLSLPNCSLKKAMLVSI